MLAMVEQLDTKRACPSDAGSQSWASRVKENASVIESQAYPESEETAPVFMRNGVQHAMQAAKNRYGSELWLRLSPSERTRAIYREMRRIDAAIARQASGRRMHSSQAEDGPSTPGWSQGSPPANELTPLLESCWQAVRRVRLDRRLMAELLVSSGSVIERSRQILRDTDRGCSAAHG